ncbi:MAG TPA: hypothetical protein VF167_12900 [Longimicrobiaceae bacterium]
MSVWKALLAGAAVGVILIAFRDSARGGWLMPAGFPRPFEAPEEEDLEEEPVLGYDGMDQETLLDWLEDADLDRETLLRTRWYEQRHQARELVLDALDSRL